MAGKGCGCKSPTLQRINENGFIEQSFDGGLTWTRFPDDARFNGPIFPPLVGPVVGTVPCAGAKSATEAMRLEIELFKTNNTAWESILGLITVLLGILTALIGPGAVAVMGIVTAFLFVLFQFGQAAFIAHDWTPDLELYKCILFCNISADASFTEAQWQQVKSDIVEQMDGLVEAWFWNHVNALGTVGLTNSARIFGSLAGDCSECNCGECIEPTTDSPQGGINLISRPDLGAGFWQVTTKEYTPGGGDNFYAQIDLGCCLLLSYAVQPGGTNAAPGNRVSLGCGGVPTHTGDYGVGNCVELILFRSFGVATFVFQIQDCP